MRDQMQELFRVALGLAEPWVVSKIEFSEQQRQLETCRAGRARRGLRYSAAAIACFTFRYCPALG